MVFHFIFGSLHDSLKEFFGERFIVQYKFILPFILIFFTALFFLIKRRRWTFNRATTYLNILLALLILIDAVWVVIKKTNSSIKLPDELAICKSCQKQDIYLIIADGYGGLRQLKQFSFDNSEFENYLKSRGFFITDSSISNYAATIFSMASMFNMDYLPKMNTQGHEIINETLFFKYLASSGYEIKNHSIFKIWDQYPYVDIRHFPTGTGLITNHTFLSRLRRDLRASVATSLNIKPELERVKNLKKKELSVELTRDSLIMDGLLKEVMNKTGKPKFVYAHFNMPHYPYLFDKNGERLNDTLSKQQQYIEYLQYANKKISFAIEQIQTTSQNAIIMFMSDHGHRNDDEKPLNPSRFLNINAVYFPDREHEGFYKGISNVNQLRILLNKKFEQDLELLKDSAVY